MNVRRALEAVAAKLGNTPTICRKCYVHPEIVTCYMEGILPSVRAGEGTRGRGLPREEAAVLRFLKGRLSQKRHPSRRTCRSPERAVA